MLIFWKIWTEIVRLKFEVMSKQKRSSSVCTKGPTNRADRVISFGEFYPIG
jgi:hypothetical protein